MLGQPKYLPFCWLLVWHPCTADAKIFLPPPHPQRVRRGSGEGGGGGAPSFHAPREPNSASSLLPPRLTCNPGICHTGWMLRMRGTARRAQQQLGHLSLCSLWGQTPQNAAKPPRDSHPPRDVPRSTAAPPAPCCAPPGCSQARSCVNSPASSQGWWGGGERSKRPTVTAGTAIYSSKRFPGVRVAPSPILGLLPDPELRPGDYFQLRGGLSARKRWEIPPPGPDPRDAEDGGPEGWFTCRLGQGLAGAPLAVRGWAAWHADTP